MVELIEWLRVFIFHYPSLEYIVIFLGAGFGGEVALLTLAFLAAQNVIGIPPLLLLSFLGIFFSDILWFFLGKTKLIKNIITHRYTNGTILVINQAIHRLSKGSDLFALIFAKFIVGTRILLLMHIGTKNIDLQKFIRYDSIAVIFWLAVIIPIGLLFGFGFTYFAQILENVYATIGFVLLVAILLIMLKIWLKNRLTGLNKEV